MISAFGSGTSREAIQVCAMNSDPASSRAAIIERPMARVESRFSSERVEIPSKPRKLSTATETAPNTRLQENVWEL